MQFGLYLVRRGTISAEQFVEALEYQLASRPQLGALAIETGKLTVKHVFQVLRAQADSPDQRFGQVAIEMELLTDDDVNELLYLQTLRVRPLGPIIDELGFVPPTVLKEQISDYYDERRSASERQLTQPV